MIIALPVTNGQLDPHFGHCKDFAMIEVEAGVIKGRNNVAAPSHEPGLLPTWLAERGVKLVIAGGLGGKAQHLLQAKNIEVIVGVGPSSVDDVMNRYLKGELSSGQNACANACQH